MRSFGRSVRQDVSSRKAGWRAWLVLGAAFASAPLSAEWYRGNTHTHTLNSDGNAAPDAVVRWYREHGYQFVVITDHEFLTDVAPLQALFGADGRFLVLPGQEVTQSVRDPKHADGERQAHVNAIGSRDLVLPVTDPSGGQRRNGGLAPPGVSIAQTYERNLRAIGAAGGLAQVNHPNFRWSVRPEDMAGLPSGILFELWNGQPEINNLGGTDDRGDRALSTEELWDVLLSQGKRIWAVASDDSHYYQRLEEANGAPPGQGWIMVRAETLTQDAIMAALRKGDFYASNGVVLDDYTVSNQEISLKIRRTTKLAGLEPDTRFQTRFIGRRGRILQEVAGIAPVYRIRGDEGYVRASIVDSNGRRAWTQPVFASPPADRSTRRKDVDVHPER